MKKKELKKRLKKAEKRGRRLFRNNMQLGVTNQRLRNQVNKLQAAVAAMESAAMRYFCKDCGQMVSKNSLNECETAGYCSRCEDLVNVEYRLP